MNFRDLSGYNTPHFSRNIAVVVIALLAVFYLWLLNEDSLRNNELITINTIKLDYVEAWFQRLKRNHMPLYFVLLKFWTEIFGTSQFALRLPSAIFGLCGVVTVWMLAKEYFKPLPAIAVLVLVGLNQTVLHVSTEIRPYSLLFFMCSLVLYGYVKYINNPDRRYLVMIVIASTVGLYSQLLILFIIVPLILYTFWLRSELAPASRNKLLLAFAIPLAVTLPFLIYWIAVQDRLASNEGRSAPDFMKSFATAMKVFFGNSSFLATDIRSLPVILGLVSLASVAAAKFYGLRPNPERRDLTGLYVVILLLLVIASGIATADAHHTTVNAPRYYIVVAAFAPILLVWTILLINKYAHRFLAAGYSVLVFGLLAANTVAFVADEGTGVREVALDMAERAPGADVLVATCASLNKSLLYYGVSESVPSCPKDIEPEEWVRRETRDLDRFWMIYMRTPFKERKNKGKEQSSFRVRTALENDRTIKLVGEIKRSGSTYYGLYERTTAQD